MSFNTNNIVTSAARMVGIISPREPVNADDMQDLIQSYNMMIDAWGASSITARASTEEQFNLQAGKRQYLWGTGAPDFNSPRPIRITAAGVIFPSTPPNFVYNIDINTSETQYFTFTDRESPSGALPTNLIYDPTFPYGTINIYPVPDQAYTLIIRSLKPMVESADQNTIIGLEATYFEAIKFNLAIRYAIEYGKPITDDLRKLARDSKRDLMKLCSKRTYLTTTYPRRNFGGFNIWTGGNFSGQ